MTALFDLIFHPEILLATNPPLFYVVARLLGVLGDGALWLRLLPLTCSLITVGLTRQLALELGSSRAQALLAAALVACSPLAVEYATDFSHYAPVAALVTLSFLLLLRALRRNSTGSWHGYLTLMVLGFYTHYIFLVVGLAHVLFVLEFCWSIRHAGGGRCLASFVRRGLVASLFVLPWLPVFFFSVEFGGLLKETTRHYYAQAPSLLPWLWDMFRALAGLAPGLGALAVIPLALWVAGLVLIRRRAPRSHTLLVLPPLMLLVHVVSMYHTMTSFLEGGAYYPFRYGLAVVPLLAIPVALALSELCKACITSAVRAPLRVGSGLALALCVAWVGAVGHSTWRQASQDQRPALREVAELLRQEIRNGDAVLVLPAMSHAQALSWYLTGEVTAAAVGLGWRPLPSGEPGWYYGPLTDTLFNPVQLQLASEPAQRLLVVSVHEGHAERPKFDHARLQEHLIESLAPSYQLRRVRVLPSVQLLELEASDATPRPDFRALLAERAGEESGA